MGPVNPVIEPVGDCRSEFQMFTELAKRFSFKDRYCKSADAWLAEICAPIKAWGGDLDELRHNTF